MKRTFNNLGVAALQSEMLSCTDAERAQHIAQLLSDFSQFMSTRFELRAEQIALIDSMAPETRSLLTEGIANTWNSGQQVNFQKDSPQSGDEPKDIIVTDPNLLFDGEMAGEWLPISIWIRYRSV